MNLKREPWCSVSSLDCAPLAWLRRAVLDLICAFADVSGSELV